MGQSRTEILEILVIEAYRNQLVLVSARVADMSTRLEADAFLKAKGSGFTLLRTDFEADHEPTQPQRSGS